MRNYLSVLALLVITTILSACGQMGTTVLNSLANTGDYIQQSDVSYGKHISHTLDIYRPKAISNNKKPVIVFFQGGCWGQCNSFKKADYRFVAQAFSSRGYITVIPNFRQYPEVNFAEIMQDASQIIHWVSKNIAQYGGDSQKIILMGHSSGAHIASMLALKSSKQEYRNKIKGFIGLAGPYDFLPLDEAYQRVLFAPSNRYAESQPINFVSPQSPPLLILHGLKDTTVFKHNAVNLSHKAQRLGVSQKLVLYPQLDHVGILLALSRPFQKRSLVLQDSLKFIQQHTR